jgi:methanethiol S-methyltransferase
MKITFLVLSWIFFCFTHSLLITPGVTALVKSKAGRYYRFYRLFYNAFSFLILVPVVIYSWSIMETPFFTWHGYLLPFKYLLIVTGLLFYYSGARHYSMKTFLGLSQVREEVNHGLINSSGKLDSSGILGIVRHPFYAGSFPLIWSGNLDKTRLIINIILSVYLVAGTLLEEQKLLSEFGDEYRAYSKRVSMLFPWKWIKSLFTGESPQ